MSHYFSSNTIIILVIKPVNIVLNNTEIVEKGFIIQITWAELGQ